MKWRRRPRPAAEPTRIELAGIPGQLVPGTITIHHTVERKPSQPPTRVTIVINDRAGYRWVGNSTTLGNYPSRLPLQLPSGAQIGIKDRETGEYKPLDYVDLEFSWERY